MEDTRNYLVSRLRGTVPSTATDTPLQQRMDAIRRGLLARDEEKGNGGTQFLELMNNFLHHAEPPCEGFRSVGEHLDYRMEDIGNRYVVFFAVFFETV